MQFKMIRKQILAKKKLLNNYLQMLTQHHQHRNRLATTLSELYHVQRFCHQVDDQLNRDLQTITNAIPVNNQMVDHRQKQKVSRRLSQRINQVTYWLDCTSQLQHANQLLIDLVLSLLSDPEKDFTLDDYQQIRTALNQVKKVG